MKITLNNYLLVPDSKASTVEFCHKVLKSLSIPHLEECYFFLKLFHYTSITLGEIFTLSIIILKLPLWETIAVY